jgi:hypothetical protein
MDKGMDASAPMATFAMSFLRAFLIWHLQKPAQ